MRERRSPKAQRNQTHRGIFDSYSSVHGGRVRSQDLPVQKGELRPLLLHVEAGHLLQMCRSYSRGGRVPGCTLLHLSQAQRAQVEPLGWSNRALAGSKMVAIGFKAGAKSEYTSRAAIGSKLYVVAPCHEKRTRPPHSHAIDHSKSLNAWSAYSVSAF